MRYFVILFALIFFPTIANAATTSNVTVENSGSESHVVVKNNVNSSSTSTVTQNGETKVYMEQSGNGTSTVNINGKEYKLEGPGKIDESISTSSNLTITPTVKPSSTLTPTPETTITPTPTKKPETNEDENFTISDAFEGITSALSKLFSAIF